MRRLVILPSLLLLAGCKAILPGVDDCSGPQPYQTAEQAPALVVPGGLDMPNTRNALRIPEVATPERPADGRCLDYPPRYALPGR